jgi:hypothetical protein
VPSHEDGFTLIEVAVATGVLVTVALGTAQMFALAIDHTIASRHQLLMNVVADRKLDELSAAAARGAVDIAPAGTLDRNMEGFADRPDDAGGVYVRRWQVSPVPGYESEALAIVVRVLPPGRTGDIQVTTIVPRGPL